MMLRNASTFIALTLAMAGQCETAYAQAAPSPYTSATRYDAMGRVTGTIAPDPDGTGPLKHAATRTSYDAAGRPVKTETGELAIWQSEDVKPENWSSSTFTILSSIETSYDRMDRKVKEVTKGSDTVPVAVVQYTYDSAGRLECTTQRMNPAAFGSHPASACVLGAEGSFGPDRITRNTYDAAGQLLKVQKAYQTPLEQDYATYTYSLNGKQTSLTDARGYKASMTYDGHDRQARWYFPSTTTPGVASSIDYEEYTYDANGSRISLRKRDGSVITYQYDALNRNTVKIIPERSGLATAHTRDVYYGYDLRGLQTYARFDSASGEGLTFSYDGFGRLLSSSLTMDGATRALSYAHDKNGNRTELTWPDARKTSYSYDGLDRMSVLYEGALALNVNLVAYGYNSRGMRNTQNGRYSQYTTFSYDPAGRLNGLNHNFPGTANDVAFAYGYTPGSQMAQQVRDNNVYAWTDHAIADRSYTTNGLNQYQAAAGASFNYDANGNLTGSTAPLESTTFVYDIENRLVSASGSKNATLRYDPLGRLYETVSGGATTRFLHDGDELIAEYDGGGALQRRYAHGQNVDDPVVWYEGSSLASPRWLHTNHQGSVIAVTDSSGGAAVAINSYDEYGIPAPGNIGRFQYTGQVWLPEIGMYYYKARIYSPTLGRFIQTDPIGYEGDINLYAYVGNDPNNLKDPTGKFAEEDRSRMAQQAKDMMAAATAAAQTVLGETAIQMGEKLEAGASRSQSIAAGRSLKAGGGAITLVTGAADVTSQIEGGKPAAAAIANTGGRALAGTAVGAGVALVLAPAELPAAAVGLAAFGVTAAVDILAGEKIGTTSERLLDSAEKNARLPMEKNGSPQGIIYYP